MSKSKNQAKYTTSLVVDIGSASVGLSVATKHDGQPAHIIASHRLPVSPARLDAEFTAYRNGLQMAAQTLFESLLPVWLQEYSFDNVCVWFAYPWADIEIVTQVSSFDSPTKITKSVFDKIQEQSLATARAQMKDHISIDSEIIVADNQRLAVELNGYSVNEPIGHTAQEVTVTNLMTLIPRDIMLSFQKLLKTYVAKFPVEYKPQSLALFHALNHTDHNKQSVLTVTIEGLHTQVVWWDKGLSKDVSTIAIGTHHIVSRLAAATQKSHLQATSMLRLFAANKLDEKYNQKIQTILKPIIGHWQSEMQRAIAHVVHSAAYTSTNTVYFFSERGMDNWWNYMIKQLNIHALLSIEEKELPVHNGKDWLHGAIIDKSGRNDALTLLSAYACMHRMHK